MTTVTIQEAESRLLDLIKQLAPGEELLITDHGQPLASMKKAESTAASSKAGCYQKTGFWMAPDFDAPLEEFREYME